MHLGHVVKVGQTMKKKASLNWTLNVYIPLLLKILWVNQFLSKRPAVQYMILNVQSIVAKLSDMDISREMGRNHFTLFKIYVYVIGINNTCKYMPVFLQDKVTSTTQHLRF